MRRVRSFKESAHVGRCGDPLELSYRAGLLDPALAHDDNLVSEPRRLGQVVCHEQRSEAKFQADSFESLMGFTARNGIECSEWLVEQDHLLSRREGTRERDALALTTGQFHWQPIPEPVRIKTNAPQRIVCRRIV